MPERVSVNVLEDVVVPLLPPLVEPPPPEDAVDPLEVVLLVEVSSVASSSTSESGRFSELKFRGRPRVEPDYRLELILFEPQAAVGSSGITAEF